MHRPRGKEVRHDFEQVRYSNQTGEDHALKAAPPLSLLLTTFLLVASAVLFPSFALADEIVSQTPSEDGGPQAIYASFPSFTSSSEDLSHLFYYSDSLFAEPADTYNEDLAYASVNMAAAANGSNTGGSDYSQKAKNIVRLLTDIGCSDVELNDGYTSDPCTVSNFGVAIGNKKINVNGQDYRLFVIGPRGGGYGQEWAGNLKVGDGASTGGDHQGFQEARDTTIAFVMNYINDHVHDGERVKVWTGGYSRGAAVANMTCAWLDKWICERNGGSVSYSDSYNAEHSVYGSNYNSDEMRFMDKVFFDPNTFIDPSVTFSESDVYCYPVNPPQGANEADVEASRDITVGIHNLLNPDDWIPQVAPIWEGWGLARYGTDHDLTGTYGPDESLRDRSKSILQTNTQGVADAIGRLKVINPDASYTSPQFRQYYLSLSTFGFEYDEAGKGNVYISLGQEMKYNQGMYFGEIVRFLFDAAESTTREDFSAKLQDDVMYLIGLIFGAPSDARDRLGSVAMAQALATLQEETGYDINTTMGKLMLAAKLEGWMAAGEEGQAGVPKKMLKNACIKTLDELGLTYDEAKIDHVAGTVANLVKGIYRKDQAIGFFNFYHLATVIEAGAGVGQAHWPEVSIAWIPEPQRKNVVDVTNSVDGAGTLSGEGVYATATTATLRAVAEDGFEFEGWYEDGSLVSSSAEWTFTVEGNRSIEARWLNQDNVSHQMTLNAYGGDFGDGQTLIDGIIVAGEVASSVMHSIPDPRYGDYTFGGWTSIPDDASTLVDLDTYRMPNHNTELFALWLEEGGSPITATAHEISMRIEGGHYPEALTRRTGETFGPLPVLKRFLPTGRYVASWTAQYGDGQVIPGGEQITESDLLTADFPDNFTLVANVATLPSRTVRFYANLDDNREATGDPLFEVEVYEDGKVRISSASPEEEDIDTGIVRYTAPERDGFMFIGWTEENEVGSGGTYYPSDATLNYNSVPEDGLDLFAAWTEGLYLIGYQGNGGTSPNGGIYAKHGTGKEGTIRIDANPFTRSGYTFIGWNTKADGSGLSVPADSEVTLAQLGLPEPQELDALIKSAHTEDEIRAALQKGTLTLYAQWEANDTPPEETDDPSEEEAIPKEDSDEPSKQDDTPQEGTDKPSKEDGPSQKPTDKPAGKDNASQGANSQPSGKANTTRTKTLPTTGDTTAPFTALASVAAAMGLAALVFGRGLKARDARSSRSTNR